MTVRHRLWVEVHYVMPIEWDSEHADRGRAIKEAQHNQSVISELELLPEHALMSDVIVDAWCDVLDDRIDGIYERANPQESEG